jgi:uncharacterized membrane protein YecN with MAPEG domain
MDMVYAVIGLALFQFYVFSILVGRARVKSGLDAPKVTGDEMFERYYRVHYNTMEQLVTFVPAILLFANYIHTMSAWILGLIYLVGRTQYFRSYIADPAKRGPGFILSALPITIMLLGGTGGALVSVFTG